MYLWTLRWCVAFPVLYQEQKKSFQPEPCPSNHLDSLLIVVSGGTRPFILPASLQTTPPAIIAQSARCETSLTFKASDFVPFWSLFRSFLTYPCAREKREWASCVVVGCVMPPPLLKQMPLVDWCWFSSLLPPQSPLLDHKNKNLSNGMMKSVIKSVKVKKLELPPARPTTNRRQTCTQPQTLPYTYTKARPRVAGARGKTGAFLLRFFWRACELPQSKINLYIPPPPPPPRRRRCPW